MTDTKELRRLALLATPGPWYDTDHSDDPVDEPRVFTEEGMQIAHVYEDWTLSYPREMRLATQRANQQYIAAASPSVVLALLDEVDGYGWHDAALVPTSRMFVARSNREPEEWDSDGIDQFDGMWVVRPRQALTADKWARWRDTHKVTHWMAIPDVPLASPQPEKEAP